MFHEWMPVVRPVRRVSDDRGHMTWTRAGSGAMLKRSKNKKGADMTKEQKEWDERDREAMIAAAKKANEIARKWATLSDGAGGQVDFAELAKKAREDGPEAERLVSARAALARADALRRVLGAGK